MFFTLVLILVTGQSTAGYLDGYNNITTWDNDGSGTGWYGAQEDNEVTPNAATGQQWDLEGFFQNGSNIAIVGGFNFRDGQEWNGQPSPVQSGDLFIDVTGDAGQGGEDNNYGYDYVLDMDFASLTYNAISLDSESTLEGVFTQFTSSNPWRYSSGGTVVQGYEDVAFDYTTGLTDAEVAFLDGGGTNSHNLVNVNLSFLDANAPFSLHFTQQCGNDLLVGYGAAPVPEPATMIMFGFGLIGLAGIGRKNLKQS
jgi:hypothetical protein